MRISRTTSGSNRPVSVMIEKKRIANSSMTPVGARFLIPSIIMSPSPADCPAMTPKAEGMTISATSGVIFLVMISVMNVATMRKPSRARFIAASLKELEEKGSEGHADAGGDGLAIVAAGIGARAIVAVPLDTVELEAVKLLRYQLTPTVAAQPSPPRARSV